MFRITCIGMLLVVGMAPVQSASWNPKRNIEFIVPSAAGGGNDSSARTVQFIFQKGIVNTPITVINKPGGAATIGLTYLSQYEGDGHYLLNAAINVLTNHIIGRSKLHYSDFSPVALLYNEYMVFVVKIDSSLKSGRDVLERLKADPTSLSLAIGTARGGTAHLALALVARAAGIDVSRLKTVVFQSNAQTATAIMGGHVDGGFILSAAGLSASKSGKLRMIGVTSPRRLAGELADIPTWKEQAADTEFAASRFILGPRGMSADQLAYWDGAFAKLVQTEEWRETLAKENWVSNYLGSKDTPNYLKKLDSQLRAALSDVGLAK
jgi:putative tricarboxylic transport membrane protein